MRLENENPSLSYLLASAIRAKLLDLHTCIPGRVETYDASTQKANIQPLLKKQYIDNEEIVNLPVVNDVPVQWPSAAGGKAHIHLPLASGDLGILVVCERSIDNYLVGDGSPIYHDDPRHHNLSDAIFIPGVLPFPKALQDTSDINLTIQNDKFRIEIAPDGTISLSGVSEELLTILYDLLSTLITDARVLTDLGPQPFITDTIIKLTAIKARLTTIKRV